MDTLNNNAISLLDADIANSKIDADYALEEMRKNVELAVKTADINVRADIANLQADTELKARQYDTDVRAEVSKKQSNDQKLASLQNTLEKINRDIGTNSYNLNRIYEKTLENLSNNYMLAVEDKGPNSPEAQGIMKQIKYYTDESLDSNGNPKGIIPKGLKILNQGLIEQQNEINKIISGITVTGP